jgi:hypothetical protein
MVAAGSTNMHAAPRPSCQQAEQGLISSAAMEAAAAAATGVQLTDFSICAAHHNHHRLLLATTAAAFSPYPAMCNAAGTLLLQGVLCAGLGLRAAADAGVPGQGRALRVGRRTVQRILLR